MFFSSIVFVQGRADRKLFMEYRHGAIMFQKTFRMCGARKSYERKYAALRKIQVRLHRPCEACPHCLSVSSKPTLLAKQFFARGYIELSRYRRAVRGFRRLQAQWRSSFCKKNYENLKRQVVRGQSRVRGFLSRKQTVRWVREHAC